MGVKIGKKRDRLEAMEPGLHDDYPGYLRQLPFYLAVLLIVGMLGFVFYTFHVRTQGAKTAGDALQTATLTVGKGTLIVEVAKTAAAQAHGLSDRPRLAQDRGMVFPISPPARPGFWIKDMSFPLDLIYIYQGRVVVIINNMPPLLVPIPFYPAALADMVLAVNAGWADKNHLVVGDPVSGL